MCTVVCRWAAQNAFPVQMLALRDELASRAFDLPGRWWPDQPDVIGGRDRLAGGSWCVSDVVNGLTGVVLNRPERKTAAAGAPSRGTLPLLAVRHGDSWPRHQDLTGMASFNLVLATPLGMAWWSFDGRELRQQALPSSTYMFTPSGIVTSGLDHRFDAEGTGFSGRLTATTEQAWPGWLDVVRDSVPSTDPAGLLVRAPLGDDTFETVFGQLIASRPGTLRLDHATQPGSGQWTNKVWESDSMR